MVEFTAGMMTMGLSLTLLIGLFPNWFFREHDRQLAERIQAETWDEAAGQCYRETREFLMEVNPYRKDQT